MEYKFSVCENDYIEFNKNHILNTKEGRKSFLLFRFSIPFFCLLLLIVTLSLPSDAGIMIFKTVFLIILSIIWICFSKKMMLQSVKTTVKKQYRLGKLPFDVETTLLFDEDTITEITPASTLKINYFKVEIVIDNNVAVYIYFNPIMAFIIPNTVFNNNDEKMELLSFIKSKINE